LRSIDLGFDTRNVATMSVMPVREYEDARKLQVFRSVVETLAATPGVKAVGANTARLLTGGRSDGDIRLPGIDPKGSEGPNSFFNAITPGYFQALGIPVQAGRDLSWRDWGSGRRYCLVNQALVDEYLAGRNPVGVMLGRSRSGPMDFEIIGVFGNARYHDPRGKIPRQTFFSLDSRIHFADEIHVYARVQGDAHAAIPQLREQVRRVDSNLLIANMGTLEDQLNLRLANERMLAVLSIAFAVLAVLLAATGLYGVLSFLAARRNREIGIRMALGARRTQVIRLILREMAGSIACGVAGGVAAAILCGRFVESQLYGVNALDSGVYFVSIAVLGACSLLAAALPAWRASRLDPTAALREQ